MAKRPEIIVPEGCKRVLLHACCAPCSSAIVEWLLAHEIEPVIYYFNPNIYPLKEYEIRKNESKRHAESLGIRWIDDDYNHESWQQAMYGLENEPERGNAARDAFIIDCWQRLKKRRNSASNTLQPPLPLRAGKTSNRSTRQAKLQKKLSVQRSASGLRTGGKTDCRNVETLC